MAVCENHNLQLASQLQQSQLDLQLLDRKNAKLTTKLTLLREENKQLLKDPQLTPKLRSALQVYERAVSHFHERCFELRFSQRSRLSPRDGLYYVTTTGQLNAISSRPMEVV